MVRHEWPLTHLDQVASRGSGHTPSKKRPEYWDGTVPWVSLADTARLDKGLVESTAKTITNDGVAHSAAVIHPAGTVILLRGSSVGKSAVLASNMAVSQDYVTWTCGPRLDKWYLYYILQARKSEFSRIAFGNTIKTIGLDHFRHLEIPLPSIGEQKAIAAAILDADQLTTALERMIAKKRAIKQGMLQQLLTGKTRLPGFTAPWEWRPFSSVMQRINAKRHQISASAYKDVGRLPVVDQGKKQIIGYTNEVSAQFDPGNGGVIVFGDHTCITKFVDFPFAIGADGTQILSALSGMSTRFLSYALEVNPVAATGYNRHFKHLREKVFPAPELAEQKAIAQALIDTDAEIESLLARYTKACAVKQGMMQQLLAGRTRLPAEEGSV